MTRLSGRVSFNPRPCARGDVRADGAKADGSWFQSTPLREGRHVDRARHRHDRLFQSTPLREGRLRARNLRRGRGFRAEFRVPQCVSTARTTVGAIFSA